MAKYAYKETTKGIQREDKRITGRIQSWPWHAPQKSAKIAVQQRQQHNTSGKEFEEAVVPVRSAVQLDDVSAAGLVMQAVHVLGDERLQPTARLQPRQRLVRSVGTHAAELVPPRKASRPVAPPRRVRRHELQPRRMA